METVPLVRVKDSIAAQLLKVVFSVYFILTLVVTFTHMSAEFFSTRDNVNHELQVIGHTFAPGLAHALWDINMEQLQPTFLGMVQFPTVVGVKLLNERGKEVGASGVVTSSDGEIIEIKRSGEKTVRGGYTGLFEYSFPIVYKQRERKIKVGEATIYSSTGVVFDKVKLGFFFIVVNAIIKTIALWTLFLWISRSMLTRPLAAFTAATARIRLDELKDFRIDVKTKGRNELKILEEAFNIMVRQLVSARNRLKDLNQSLEQKVRERTLQLEKSNRAKSEFLANMSHELRTPLNGILGYAQILKRKQGVDTLAKDGLNIIYQSGRHLLTLINDILDLSKIEARKMELYPNEIGLADFIEGISGIIWMRAGEEDIKFVCEAGMDLPSGILADEKRLRQVLLNLLGNAVKFTAGGRVSLRVRVVNMRDGIADMRFEVGDTGVGMKPEQLEKIFNPFEQVGDTSKRTEGTGLGLAISKQIVELMGGKLCVESEFGKGSRFWFDASLPVVELKKEVKPDEQGEITGYKGQRRRVLVVDDHRDNRMVLLDLLKPLGFDVVLAKNGMEGVDKARETRPDTILMDLVMPVMNGFEAVKTIRKIPEFKDTPILAVSASALDMDREKSRVAGCDGFLSKPVGSSKLLDFLESHLQIQWTHEEISDEAPDFPTESSGEIIPPGKNELETIYELAMLGKMRRIRNLATEMEERDPKFFPFAGKLRDLANAFEDEKVVEFVKQYLGTDE